MLLLVPKYKVLYPSKKPPNSNFPNYSSSIFFFNIFFTIFYFFLFFISYFFFRFIFTTTSLFTI